MKTIILIVLLFTFSLTLLSQTPQAWPDAGDADFTKNWIPYTRLGLGIKDKEGSTDPSNGGTTPTQYVDVVGNSLSVVSVFYGYDSLKQTLFVRMRMEVDVQTNSPDGASNDDPFNNGTWCLLIDTDGDGWKEFVVMLDGQTGSPSSPIDETVVYYENTNTQSLVSATKTFSKKMIFPDSDARTEVSDYGWGRAIRLASGPSGDFYLDWQIPISAFNGLVTENTHIAFGYSTANSNTDPLQKDLVYQGNFIGATSKQFPFGDQLTLKDGLTQIPYAEIITIAGCNPTTIDAKIIDLLDVNEAGQGSIQSSIKQVDFYYRKQSGGPDILIGTQTTPYDPGTSWGLYRIVWNNALVPQGLYYIFCKATDLQNNVGTSAPVSYNHYCGPVGVDVSGFVYNDANHNSMKDANETGTTLSNLFAKIFLTSSPAGPASQAVAVNATTGAYSFPAVAVGTYYIIIDDNSLLSDVAPNIPAGWVGTESPTFTKIVNVQTTVITNQNFGLYNGCKLSGRVFYDTGVGGGLPNNGKQDGTEFGITDVFIQATNADGSIVYDVALTNGAGDYTLFIPASAGTVKIKEYNMPNTRSTGGSAGTTSGAYDRATDTTTFTAVAGTVYTNVNFADVPTNTLMANQQKSALPGTVVSYTHTFIPGTGGQVFFNTTQIASPNMPGWNQVLYQDTNCNGAIDIGEPILTSSTNIDVTAGQKICLILQEFVPSNAPNMARDVVSVIATFKYLNADPALADDVLVNSDITVVNTNQGNLRLIKQVDKPNAKPGEKLLYTVVYINVGRYYVQQVILSDPISPLCDFLPGQFTDGKDILWQKPDGSTVFLTAIVDTDEGSVENKVLYIRMGSTLQVPAGSSGIVQYYVQIK